MALANYSDLLSAVANWTARTDLTSRIPEFVTLAESDFNRELRVAQMLVNNQNFTVAGEYVNQPSGFLELKDWYLNVSPRAQLCYLPDDAGTPFYSATGQPKYYDISGTQFRIFPTPNGSFSTTIRYWQAIPGLQANSVNWLMTAHPNLYLFNTLMQAFLYLKDDGSAAKWRDAWTTELQSIKSADRRMRWGGSGMAVRSAGTVV